MKPRFLLILTFSTLLYSCSKPSKEEKFWIWFEKNNKVFLEDIKNFDPNDFKSFTELKEQLEKVHPDLVFVFGGLKGNGSRQFTISADGLNAVFPAVIKLVDAAPTIPNWDIFAFRQRIPGDDLEIQYDDFSISHSDVYYDYIIEEEKIGLELYIRDFNSNPRKQNAIFILLDALLGEYDTEIEISWIEWNELSQSQISGLNPLYKLRKLVASRKN